MSQYTPEQLKEWADGGLFAIGEIAPQLRAHAAALERCAKLEGLLLLALYHHQGGSSPVGQPIRKALGIGPFDHMTDEQIERAITARRADFPKEPR